MAAPEKLARYLKSLELTCLEPQKEAGLLVAAVPLPRNAKVPGSLG